jgi:hypothetical protein
MSTEPFGFDVCAISLILATILYSFDDEHRQRVSPPLRKRMAREKIDRKIRKGVEVAYLPHQRKSIQRPPS